MKGSISTVQFKESKKIFFDKLGVNRLVQIDGSKTTGPNGSKYTGP